MYGFNVYHAPEEPLTVEEAAFLHTRLAETFALRPFAYSPISPDEIQTARQWENPEFPVYFPEGLNEPEYEVYSARSNYGRIRLFTLSQLNNALDMGLVGWQDIIVIDQAPTDIETVVAGIITGTRQGELSHVNVRALRRGTPNAYVQNPLQAFEPYRDTLVKLTLTGEGYQVNPDVTLDEAEAWWEQNRGAIPPLPAADDVKDTLLRLNQNLESRFANEPGELIQTYGGKAGQLAMLYTFLDPGYQVEGFAIPFRYYQEFMRSNLIPSSLDTPVMVTYEEYIHLLMQDERFAATVPTAVLP